MSPVSKKVVSVSIHTIWPEERGRKARKNGHLAGKHCGEMGKGDPVLLDFLNELLPLYAVSVLFLKDCSDFSQY